MDNLDFIGDRKQTLHHFYIIEGDRDIIIPVLHRNLEKRGMAVANNPNITTEIYESFTVKDGVSLRARQAQSAFGGDQKFFIIAPLSITHEAEQALLKAFEEPTANTHFMLVVRNAGALAETILSRAQLIAVKANLEARLPLGSLASKFVSAVPAERLAIIAKLIKSHEDDETTGALRDEALALLNTVEKSLHDAKKDLTAHDIVVFEEIAKARMYLGTRGAGTKMLLEHIALIL